MGEFSVDLYKTEAAALYIAQEIDHPGALDHSERIVAFMSYVCSSNHPLLNMQKMTLAELNDKLGNKEEAKVLYEEVAPVCEIIYGAEHETTKKFKALALKDIRR